LGFGSLEDLTRVAVILAVALSVLVRMTSRSARRLALEEGRARLADLCELTGILEPRSLQDIFGPPTLEGVWTSLSLARVRAARRPIGRLIADDNVDVACLAVAGLAGFSSHWIVDIALALALAVQVTGWSVMARTPK
jgi:hypothetical protein